MSKTPNPLPPSWDSLWELPENREFDAGPSWRSKLRLLKKIVAPIGVQGRILDVACGMGRLLPAFQDRVTDMVGVDMSQQGLNAAQKYFPHARYQQLDIEKEALPEIFDWVFCTNALEEMTDDVAALRHMAQMTTEGGHLMLIVPHRKVYWTSKDTMAGNKRRYERAELIDKIEKVGLKVVATQAWGWPLYRLWYRLMERVDQRAVWDAKPAVTGATRLAARLVYGLLFLDDLFTWLPFGSILFLVAQKPAATQSTHV